MDLEQLARFGLVFAAGACLWLGFLAWREAEGAPPLLRALGAAIGCAAAAIIVYGLTLG